MALPQPKPQPRPALTKKRRAAIHAFVIHRDDYWDIKEIIDATLAAERLPADDLYARLFRAGYVWKRGGWNKRNI